eukprot:NODE_685_length_1984_cov_16.704910_g633_i0.p1 GENE.NODE_685_length_1984_cov_16.704910_g633_i0~~NODE_685_length_1984_cov_16.704910_g633_i0.p1  ORF type:complete len:605 (+),score=188.84 NODE_685_length_1984_cov_16.704910_g633_i0:69-1817(+)
MQRPPSQSGFNGMRPPSGGMRPPSGGAPGSRAGTAFQPMMGMGTALNTQLEVTNRPVTKEGMAGVAPGSQGPGRTVADRSYFMGVLRAKNTELQAEIQRLKAQEEHLTKSSSAVASMDRRTKDVQAEVNALKEMLADYNFAVSKGQSGSDLDAIKDEMETLKAQNELQSKRVDEVFLSVKSAETKAKEAEAQIKLQLDQLDNKLNAEPEKRAQYYSLREQSGKLQEELIPMQRDLELLQRKNASLNAELKADQSKQAAFKLQDKKTKLEKQKAALLEEIRTSENGKLPDEKTKLLNQVKADTAEIEAMQKEADDIKKDIQTIRDAIMQIDVDLADYKSDKAEKYKELETKDREMQEFISRFDDSKREVTTASAKAEETIVHLLEAIGKTLSSTEHMPAPSQVGEMQAEIDFKRRQMDFSVSTHERLKNELELRKKELEKVDNLDAKISNELVAITEKIKQNEDAIRTYSNLEALRQDADQRKRELTVRKSRVSRLRDALKQSVQVLSQELYEPLRQSMDENEVHAQLQIQEQKIRQINQTVFSLGDFIAQKGSEGDYLPTKMACLSTSEEINKFIIEQNLPK